MTNRSKTFAGSWIVDAGPNQVKTITTYTPTGEGQYAAAESVFNFDWSLGGGKPTATHATNLIGVVEESGESVQFTMICYVLDETEKAVYIMKATGSKILTSPDTISVQNLIFHIYKDPESCNPVTDLADFTIPESGTFPPIHEYRIRL
jgi:hypothetical protein